jgi:hypothetical protein
MDIELPTQIDIFPIKSELEKPGIEVMNPYKTYRNLYEF